MNIESILYDGIRYIGVLAPVPTAYVIAMSLDKHLHWHIVIAIVAALIIEVVGFGVVYMYAIFREYNQSKRKTDPAAPLGIVAGMVALYLVSVLLLTVVLDIFPAFSIYAPGLFPFLSVIGMALTALRFDHAKRLEVIAEEKRDRKAGKVTGKLPESTAPLPEPVKTLPEPVTETAEDFKPKITWSDLLSPERAAIAGMTTKQILTKYKDYQLSERTARNWKANAAVSLNGHGKPAGNGKQE